MIITELFAGVKWRPFNKDSGAHIIGGHGTRNDDGDENNEEKGWNAHDDSDDGIGVLDNDDYDDDDGWNDMDKEDKIG